MATVSSECICIVLARVGQIGNGDRNGRLAAIGCVYRWIPPIGVIGWIENVSSTVKCSKLTH